VRITVTPGELRLRNDLQLCRQLMGREAGPSLSKEKQNECEAISFSLVIGEEHEGIVVQILHTPHPLELKVAVMGLAFRLQVTRKYPHKPPELFLEDVEQFEGRPAFIGEGGRVSLEILESGWSSVFSLVDVLKALLHALLARTPESAIGDSMQVTF